MTLVGPFQQSPQARFQAVEQPGALPGSCLLCNGSYDPETRPWFIDTGLQIEFHGAGYICAACLIEMAEVVGFITPDIACRLVDELNAARQDKFNLEVQIASLHELESAVDSFVRTRAARRHPSGGRVLPFGSSGVPESGGVSGTGPTESGDAPQGAADQSGAPDGAPDEPGHGQGVDDLRPNDGGDADFVLGWPKPLGDV